MDALDGNGCMIRREQLVLTIEKIFTNRLQPMI